MHSGQCLFVSTESLDGHWDRALRETYLKHVVPIHLGSSVRPKIPMDRAPMKTQSSMTRQHHPIMPIHISQHKTLYLPRCPSLKTVCWNMIAIAWRREPTGESPIEFVGLLLINNIPSGRHKPVRAGMTVGRIRR